MRVRIEQTLGTSLRKLIELLDGDVDRAYAAAGLDFRAVFTPVVRALLVAETLSVRELADTLGTTHSAASQTVAQMRRAGLLETAASTDGRERRVQLTAEARRIQPAVQAQWDRTMRAATQLDAEIGVRLNEVVHRAIDALERRPFLDRARPETDQFPSASGSDYDDRTRISDLS